MAIEAFNIKVIPVDNSGYYRFSHMPSEFKGHIWDLVLICTLPSAILLEVTHSDTNKHTEAVPKYCTTEVTVLYYGDIGVVKREERVTQHWSEEVTFKTYLQ